MSLSKTNIQKYLQKKDTSYKIFDIKYTEKEKKAINNFKIENEISFYYYGKFNENTLLKEKYNDKKNILNFISNIGNNSGKDIQIIKDIIYKLLEKVTKSYNKDYILLEIRISLPNKYFDITRWHFDGYENQSKFVTLLKGPSTLFIDDKDIKSKKIYFEIDDKKSKETNKNGIKIKELIKIDDKYRKILAKKLKDAKIVQPTNNQGAIFLTDLPKNIDKSVIHNKLVAIHSEPINNNPRFFISVICGTQYEINKFADIHDK
jgi:hypothetical protein